MDKKQKKRGVFMMRAEGQSFEEFQKACVKVFRDVGMLKESKPLPEKTPEPSELKLLNQANRPAPVDGYMVDRQASFTGQQESNRHRSRTVKRRRFWDTCFSAL